MLMRDRFSPSGGWGAWLMLALALVLLFWNVLRALEGSVIAAALAVFMMVVVAGYWQRAFGSRRDR